MVFSSVTFLFYFLPIFLIAYFLAPQKARNVILLFASILFYAWGEVYYTLILILSIFVNYITGLLIEQFTGRRSKTVLAVGIALNLGLLFYFKYAYFFSSNLIAALGRLPFPIQEPIPIHLPLGISFFTFQAISYLVDVYRKEAEMERKFTNLALFISMFPQLIAGPIVRYQTISSDIRRRLVSIDNAFNGVQIFILGLAQKVLIANTVALPADAAFESELALLGPIDAWFGLVCYTLQIYFDFAGYSNMAIGLGYLLGFKFPENFNYPYISKSVTEFWRRWHISLSRWFRDYLYIPLGGNRQGQLRTFTNLFIVFLLCGLWHGAQWNFLLWGGYHGLFLVIERICLENALRKLKRPFQHVYLLLVVMLGWVLFRVESLEDALTYYGAMFGLGPNSPTTMDINLYVNFDGSVYFAIAMGIVSASPLWRRLFNGVFDLFNFSKQVGQTAILARSLRTGIIYVLLFFSVITLAAGTYNPFIYFRF